MKFDVSKKGYDTEQVDNFINKLSVKYEEKLAEQKDRVFSLKNELSLMEERLENYKDKINSLEKRELLYFIKHIEDVDDFKKVISDNFDRIKEALKNTIEIYPNFNVIKMQYLK